MKWILCLIVIATFVACDQKPAMDGLDAKAYYSAEDFGLPKGIVLDFGDNGNEQNRKYFESGHPEMVFVRIEEADGHILVVNCSYKAWASLHPKDVLK